MAPTSGHYSATFRKRLWGLVRTISAVNASMRIGRRPRRGAVEHAGLVPLALGPDQHQRIARHRERMGMGRDIAFDLDIFVIGEGEADVLRHRLEAEALPERDQPLPRMGVHPRRA